MKVSSIAAIALGLVSALGAGVACGSRPSGRVVVGVKDGPPTSSDGRTISSLEIDVTRIELEAREGTQTSADGGSAEDAGKQDDQGEQEEDVTVFAAGNGPARTIDLLKVTSFSALVADTTVPAATYEEGRITITAARVTFADAPTVAVPLILEGDNKKSKASYEFHFRPPVTVGTTGTAVAVLDFVPNVQKDGSGGYHLGHDADHDDSGDRHDNAEVEVHGKVVAFDAAKKLLTLEGGTSVDVSAASIELNGRAALLTDIAVGLKAEAEGQFDSTAGVLKARRVELQ